MKMSSSKHQDYIKLHLQSLLNELATSVLSSLPSDLASFTLSFLESRKKCELSHPEQEELKHLRIEVERLRSGHNPDEETEVESISNSDSDDIIEDHEILAPVVKKYRTSVSAEAYGLWNRKSEFNPRQISKTNEQRQRIIEVINKCFMFSALDKTEREVLILAFEERKFEPGFDVIRQGDDGNELFVVDSGELACSKRFGQDKDARFIKNYGPGDAFGELALLYNVPRAASIKATSEAICWVLDRDCFNHIVKEAARKKRETYESFLASVKLFKEIDDYERSQMADALQTIEYESGEYVIHEGEWGDVFYIVEEGQAVATKTLVPGKAPEEVLKYEPGGYFGELALLKGAPRAANVIATSHLKCAIMDRRAFKRLLGPLEDILKRNASGYEGYKF
jgi:cAMP-dependent protein kinase regulator